MSILHVKERFAERRFDADAQGVRATRAFWVETSGVDVGVESVRQALDPTSGLKIPILGEIHPEITYIYAISVQAEPIAESHKNWLVTVEYGLTGQAQPQEWEDPLQEPPEITWDSESHAEPYRKDVDGNLSRAANGQEFDPLPERDVSWPVLVIVKNQPANYNIVNIKAGYENRINTSTWGSWGPRTARCRKVAAAALRRGTLDYWRVTYEFVCDPQTWDAELLNQGTYWMDRPEVGPPAVMVLRDDAGNVIEGTVLLAANGDKLPEGDDPNYIVRRPYLEADFNDLGLL